MKGLRLNMINKEDVQGLVLAGGQGSRMGGVDKGLQEWQSKPLVGYCLSALVPLCHSVFISCNRNSNKYSLLADDVIPDLVEGFQGPLSGLVSAFPHVTADWLLIVPCDTPLITADLLSLLLEETKNSPDKVIFALAGEDKDHPLHSLIHKSAFASVCSAFDEGKRSAYRVFNSIGVEWVLVPDETQMANINTLE